MADIEWITLNATAGTGNSAVTWSVPAWTGSTDRSVELRVSVPGILLSETVAVTQKGTGGQPPADGQFYIIIRDVNFESTVSEPEITIENVNYPRLHYFKYSYDGSTWSEPADKLPVTEDMLNKIIYLKLTVNVGRSICRVLRFSNLKEMEVGGSLKSVYVDGDEPYPDETADTSPGFLSELGYELTDAHNLTADTLINQANFANGRSVDPPHFPDRMEAPTVDPSVPEIIDFRNAFGNSLALTGTVVMPSEIIGTCHAVGMFRDITYVNLSTPVLPKTVSGDMYMREMFCGSTLSVGPTFPTNVGGNLYAQDCFSGCTALTTPPVLPERIGGECSLEEMFKDCTSLTEGPLLPGTIGGSLDIRAMYSGCTSLSAASMNISIDYFSNLYNVTIFRGVSPTGVLKVLSGETMTDEKIRDILHIPSGWTIQRVL